MMLAMLLALTTLFVGFGSLSQNPASGGYQLFERIASGISADIPLASLENFAPPPEIAPEYANAPSTVELPPGSRKLEPVGAQVTAPKGYDVYQAPDGTRYYQDAKGNNYASLDDLPTPTGQFEGKYVSNPKHDSSGGSISPQPKNPEATIADSVPVGGNSNKRIAYDSANNEIVVYQYDPGTGAYHGYAPQEWTRMPQQERNALIRAGLFKPNGKPKT